MLLLAGGVTLGIPGVGAAPAGPFSGEQVTLGQERSSSEVPAGSEAATAGTFSAGTDSASVKSVSGQVYTVKGGDNLCAIALRLLGDPRRYQEIVRLNTDRYPSLAKNPNLILVGWELRLPEASGTGNPATSPTASGESASRSPSAAQAVVPAATEKSPSTSAVSPTAGTPLIGPGQRVLHIGDSHTVGIYGSTIDEAMRKTGAQVRTYGVAGSSPSWWYQGTVTKCGYYGRDEKGNIDRPADWRTPRATPSLPELIKEYKPTVLVVSLGANLFGSSEAAVRRETQRIIDTAKAAGCTLVWVGPPRARESVTSIATQDRLCEAIKSTVGSQGTFVDSRPLTQYPTSGGDGLHYWGTEGSRTAKSWAGNVLNTIQTSGK